ncbi:MAG: DNA replication and repair protein RecF [Acidimicrobiales bacterium]|nr:MAG: DNA replication/repair protein RecF [Actinomycetota bacterium]MBV6509764.1 DNA replication and repair protein RecF [Acidimicrobiales bacterium]RIK04842.1 MAG: DNA replication and repair protein RecF [Acidobacteriota bacterium]
MRVRRLWLTDFRNYRDADITLGGGFTVVVGPNGCGKTSLLEAIGYLARLESFRGATLDTMVRHGAGSSVIRAEAESRNRELLIEAELVPGGRSRCQLNRQPVRNGKELASLMQVSVFTPDDVLLVKGGPVHRRRFLDETLGTMHSRNLALRHDLERVLRQRNALLKQAGGRTNAEVEATLDVWDGRLAEVGEELAALRSQLVGRLQPVVGDVYGSLAESRAATGLTYRRGWAGDLLGALKGSRCEDLRRTVTTVGPQRDELDLVLGDLPARTHASQGEQRTLALSLRLAGHQVATETLGFAPVLLLDDVLSELDERRSRRLVGVLPEGQSIMTTAGALPEGDVHPELVLSLEAGRVR